MTPHLAFKLVLLSKGNCYSKILSIIPETIHVLVCMCVILNMSTQHIFKIQVGLRYFNDFLLLSRTLWQLLPPYVEALPFSQPYSFMLVTESWFCWWAMVFRKHKIPIHHVLCLFFFLLLLYIIIKKLFSIFPWSTG